MAKGENILYGPTEVYPVPDIPLGQHLLKCLRHHGDKPAQTFINDGHKYTFSDLAERGCSVAVELEARGIGVGDIVSVCIGVCPEFTPIMLGTLFVGATLSPLNYKFDTNDFGIVLELVQPRIIISTPESVGNIERVLSNLKLKTEVVILGTPSWNKFLSHATGPDYQPADVKDHEDKEALIMCSSGTTGLPKGVMVTQKALMVQLAIWERGDDLIKLDDKLLHYSSPFWISAPVLNLLGIYMGVEMLLGVRFEEEMFLKTIEEHKVTFPLLPPNHAVAVAKSSIIDHYDISSLRGLFVGGASMGKETQQLVEQRLKITVVQGYGMTEILFAIRMLPDFGHKEGSSGKPVRRIVCKVVDEDTGRAVGPYVEGELCMKGPTLTKGYYRNPEATAAAIDKDGWLHSGDVAYYDDEGFFYIVDRIKDLIKYRGNHVAPVEIESQLLEHPEVKDCAVVGVKHDLNQERPMAVVIRQPGSKVTEKELVDLVQDKLAEHKWLRGGVRFVDELPMTPTGKVQRRKVRDMVNS
ncbi:luciferin 4-monooxygenase isoform X1 [Anabrus simplex]|uniref:luciferin 4-monooxygenase isoform X1 n=1 Tax=Anabrus simplex TaxID=316456 RepID=UPI0035A33E44